MKSQYLGDAKDSFKWDYHNYLTVQLRCRLLQAVLLLTPDDGSSDGDTDPKKFQADKFIWDFCDHLREKRHTISDDEISQLLGELPKYTRERGKYKVAVDLGCVPSGKKMNRVIFFDPDIGFEPDGGAMKKHVRYCEIGAALDQISNDDTSVVSVFQDLIRKSPDKAYRAIKEQLPAGCVSTAIFWRGGKGGVMFVILAKLKSHIKMVQKINRDYKESICKRGGVVELLDNPLSDSNIRQKEKK